MKRQRQGQGVHGLKKFKKQAYYNLRILSIYNEQVSSLVSHENKTANKKDAKVIGISRWGKNI